MSRKRSPTHISHLEHLCANPGSACFDSFARAVVFRVCLLKIRKHSFGTIRSTSCQRPLILFVVFLVSSHSMVALPLHRRSCGISICFPWLIDFGVPIFLLLVALPIVAGLVCVGRVRTHKIRNDDGRRFKSGRSLYVTHKSKSFLRQATYALKCGGLLAMVLRSSSDCRSIRGSF